MEKKKLTKLITKTLFAFYIIFSDGLFGFFSVIIAWPIIISLAVDIYQRYRNKDGVSKKHKLSQNELNLVNKIKTYLSSHDQIYVNDNVSLKRINDSDDVYNSLGVFFAGEYVAQLADFQSYDQETYQTILTDMKFSEETPVNEQQTLNAESFIERINEYNTDIDHEEISNYLYLTSSLLSNIDVLEKRGVSDQKKTRKLYMYYLPILMDILENYRKMKDNKYVVSDVKQMEEKLIKTIILCNEAIKTLLASMNDEDLMNMSVNMNTLENILKKDGLIKAAEFNRVKESVK